MHVSNYIEPEQAAGGGGAVLSEQQVERWYRCLLKPPRIRFHPLHPVQQILPLPPSVLSLLSPCPWLNFRPGLGPEAASCNCCPPLSHHIACARSHGYIAIVGLLPDELVSDAAAQVHVPAMI